MTRLLNVVLCGVMAVALAPVAGAAQTEDTVTRSEDAVARWRADPQQVFQAGEVDLDQFRWIARPVVVFAGSEFDPSYAEQIALLEERWGALTERDVVVISDTAPGEMSEVRTRLRPRGFMLALIGKDGQVALRKPFPWDVREITRSIDKMPMRQQEIRAGGNEGG